MPLDLKWWQWPAAVLLLAAVWLSDSFSAVIDRVKRFVVSVFR